MVLPSRGLRAQASVQQQFFHALNTRFTAPGNALKSFATLNASGMPKPKLRVIDSIDGETSAKLVEMSPDDMTALRMQDPGARIVPEVFYQTCEVRRLAVKTRIKTAATTLAVNIVLECLSAADNTPIKGADVVAFTDFDQRIGASGKTNAQGKVSLTLGGSSITVQRLYIYPKLGFWGLLKKNLTLQTGKQFKLQAITFPVTDELEQIYGAGQPGDGLGVKVAVLDTGVGPHPDLVVSGGENTVVNGNPALFQDNGDMHGTHVAGIIAARGTAPTGRTGVAPGTSIFSYRVFDQGEDASNFAIAKAIDRAVQAGCHLINMSLGGGTPDPAISSAIADARNMGVAVIISAGNDDRGPVSFPGNDARAVAVSAMGRKGTFPSDSVDSGDVQAPFGTNPNDFIAGFSNIGPQVAVTGLGVGIVSTVPGGYAVMSGTSMACPAVVGFTARLLSQNPAILSATPDQTRSDNILQLLLGAAKDMGFATNFQGHGLPQ